ncbi:creatininase family protein [Thermodesulfobacteriota bacterium]
MKVRLDEMTCPEVKEAITKRHAVILPLGATEEHGAHLPLYTDSHAGTYIAEHAAGKVAEAHDIRVMVAPTIVYTDVSMHKKFPGTIGVKVETLINTIVDIVEGFLDQGFKNVIALNAHLQNACSLESAFRIVADRRPKANIFAVTSVLGLGFEAMPGLVKAGPVGMGHALEVETSCALFMHPEHVYLDRVVTGSRKLPLSERYVGPTGGFRNKGVIYCPEYMGHDESGIAGDPAMASREAGEKLLTAIISDLADIIVQVASLEEE